ncbi:hypothetical protein BIY24_09615 [Halobacteriovorax marinus]|uniref:DUF4286 family protein n=1 Tax=Halobacteriovorax marinus TaxID=97084 RepID=UPI000BC34F3E|nr:DUF4286 family protein [Halobacteriovorax marinus]ATH08197.1 hypothetical protein BIY24_09615 [Halobacteriovorax marinus]
MIEYEVTIDITDTDMEAYKLWLEEYCQQVIELEGFIDIRPSITKVLERYYACIRYIVKDKKVLQEFIKNKEKNFSKVEKSIKKRILEEGDV